MLAAYPKQQMAVPQVLVEVGHVGVEVEAVQPMPETLLLSRLLDIHLRFIIEIVDLSLLVAGVQGGVHVEQLRYKRWGGQS